VQTRKQLTRRQSIGLVFLCTLIGAAGQMLIKAGANTLARPSLLAMMTNVPLISGYVLYGLMTVLFIYALRDEELSILYPVISLTYVWVTGLSVYFLNETLNLPKLVGVLVIVLGVAVLGKGGSK
jgi:drug/metabolite transporter (DMT)-like permease